MGYANKVDANQSEIVEALRRAGYSVTLLNAAKNGIPDLLAGGEMPCPLCRGWFVQNRLIEIKTRSGCLTTPEKAWHMEWQGQVGIARTIEEALRIVGR